MANQLSAEDAEEMAMLQSFHPTRKQTYDNFLDDVLPSSMELDAAARRGVHGTRACARTPRARDAPASKTLPPHSII
jgi:hypothetical protein